MEETRARISKKRLAERAICDDGLRNETPIAGEADFWAEYSSGPNTEGADSEEQDVDGCEMLPPETQRED